MPVVLPLEVVYLLASIVEARVGLQQVGLLEGVEATPHRSFRQQRPVGDGRLGKWPFVYEWFVNLLHEPFHGIFHELFRPRKLRLLRILRINKLIDVLPLITPLVVTYPPTPAH